MRVTDGQPMPRPSPGLTARRGEQVAMGAVANGFIDTGGFGSGVGGAPAFEEGEDGQRAVSRSVGTG